MTKTNCFCPLDIEQTTMASFILRSSSCDGHIRALNKAILMASKISKDALIEFTPKKMRICARTDLFLVKFTFVKDFFSDYQCNERLRIYINLKALLMPFKSSILVGDREGTHRSQVRVQCMLESQSSNQIIFKIGSEPPAAILTYKLIINDLDPTRKNQFNAINRSFTYASVVIAPKQTKKDRFLLSAFNSFAPDIDQVTIKTSQSEVKFIGSINPLQASSNTTSEFTHKRDDFSTYTVNEDVNVTIPLRSLKLFLAFVETNRIQTFPKYIFEAVGKPAHFIYEASLYLGHFIVSTSFDYIPDELDYDIIPAIDMGNPNESFIGEESAIQPAFNQELDMYNQIELPEEEEDEEDGYNDNESDLEEYIDGNLDGLDPTGSGGSHTHNSSCINNHYNNSVFGNTESIRSEMSDMTLDPSKARELLDLDKDPDELENVTIEYSSDSDDD